MCADGTVDCGNGVAYCEDGACRVKSSDGSGTFGCPKSFTGKADDFVAQGCDKHSDCKGFYSGVGSIGCNRLAPTPQERPSFSKAGKETTAEEEGEAPVAAADSSHTRRQMPGWGPEPTACLCRNGLDESPACCGAESGVCFECLCPPKDNLTNWNTGLCLPLDWFEYDFMEGNFEDSNIGDRINDRQDMLAYKGFSVCNPNWVVFYDESGDPTQGPSGNPVNGEGELDGCYCDSSAISTNTGRPYGFWSPGTTQYPRCDGPACCTATAIKAGVAVEHKPIDHDKLSDQLDTLISALKCKRSCGHMGKDAGFAGWEKCHKTKCKGCPACIAHILEPKGPGKNCPCAGRCGCPCDGLKSCDGRS